MRVGARLLKMKDYTGKHTSSICAWNHDEYDLLNHSLIIFTFTSIYPADQSVALFLFHSHFKGFC